VLLDLDEFPKLPVKRDLPLPSSHPEATGHPEPLAYDPAPAYSVPAAIRRSRYLFDITESELVCTSTEACFEALLSKKESPLGRKFYISSCVQTRNFPRLPEYMVKLYAYGVQHVYIWDNFEHSGDLNVTEQLEDFPNHMYTIVYNSHTPFKQDALKV